MTPNSTRRVTSRHDTTRSLAHAFWHRKTSDRGVALRAKTNLSFTTWELRCCDIGQISANAGSAPTRISSPQQALRFTDIHHIGPYFRLIYKTAVIRYLTASLHIKNSIYQKGDITQHDNAVSVKVIHYWIGDVQDCQGVSASEMTCIVSSGALNSTHSLMYYWGLTFFWYLLLLMCNGAVN